VEKKKDRKEKRKVIMIALMGRKRSLVHTYDPRKKQVAVALLQI
jgi:hypothetical protein